jgi:TM2 domain-containing membrane protein YozV
MTEGKTKYCPYCGAQIDYKYTTCPSCGKPQPLIDGIMQERKLGKKSPILAAVLSLLIPGVGQIYLGKVGRGLIFLVSVLLLNIIISNVRAFSDLMILMIMGLSWVISAWDAYRLALQNNKA